MHCLLAKCTQLSRLLSIKQTFVFSYFRSFAKHHISDFLTIMPKEKVNTEGLRKARIAQQEKNAANGRPASTISLQVLGRGCRGSPGSLYVLTDTTKYLFNCGEGTQRVANEHKVKLAKLEHVFITRNTWGNIGGLPGLFLTVQDIGVPKVTLHASPGLEKLTGMTRGFIQLRDFSIDVSDLSTEVYQDHILSVRYVPIYGQQLDLPEVDDVADLNEANIDYYSYDRKRKRSKSPPTLQPTTSKRLRVENEYKREMSLAFICKATDKLGQLSLEKCVQFGVPPGPLLGELKDGKDVTLPDGRTVKSVDVVLPPQPGPVFIVCECPSEEYFASLLNNPVWKQHQAESSDLEQIAIAVVHFTPSHVAKHPAYQEWIAKFATNCYHIMMNDDCVGPSSMAVHRIQYKLNLLHPGIFPLLAEHTQEENMEICRTSNTSQAQTLLSLHLRPLAGLDNGTVVSVNPDLYVSEAMETENFSCLLQQLKESLKDSVRNPEGDKLYPQILFLGTGSSVPSKVRNTSGILLHTSAITSILLDCSEGTTNQLYRFFGSDLDKQLVSIQAVFISHLHADHHMGLISILQERRRAYSAIGKQFIPLVLVAPYQIMYWLRAYNNCFEKILSDFVLVPNAPLENCDPSPYQNLLSRLGFLEVLSVPVKHCRHAFGCVVVHSDGWKLVYSGDTMPCDSLVQYGKDCDILIHEATMEDYLKDEAIIKAHSTTTQAIEVGEKMAAKFILLTHFSQRYAKIPLINEKFGNNVGIAFDNMRVSLKDLPQLPLLIPGLKALFAEYYEEMEGKTAKKMLAKERESRKTNS